MGLDYSFDFICRRDQLWDLLLTAQEHATASFMDEEVEFWGSLEWKNQPLREIWQTPLTFRGESAEGFFGIRTAMYFPEDGDIRDYLGQERYEAQLKRRTEVELLGKV